jgi:tetratricopeptide (TPR) repeat protein
MIKKLSILFANLLLLSLISPVLAQIDNKNNINIEDSTKIIQLRPDAVFAYKLRGFERYNQRDLKGAIEDFNKVIQLEPGYVKAYYFRGSAKYDLKDYKGAIYNFNKTIQLTPNDADAYCFRALAKYNLNDYKGAVDDLEKTKKLFSDQKNWSKYKETEEILNTVKVKVKSKSK